MRLVWLVCLVEEICGDVCASYGKLLRGFISQNGSIPEAPHSLLPRQEIVGVAHHVSLSHRIVTEITWLYWNGTMRDIRVVAAYRDDSWRRDEDAILQYSKSRGCSRRGLPFPEREEIHKDVVSRIW